MSPQSTPRDSAFAMAKAINDMLEAIIVEHGFDNVSHIESHQDDPHYTGIRLKDGRCFGVRWRVDGMKLNIFRDPAF